jgi:ArsR family transcriptional regulator
MASRTNDVEWAAGVLQLVGHPIRLRVLNLLRHAGELCVGDLCEVLRLPQSTASRHLGLLREGGLVAVRQVGLWVYYRRTEPADALHGALAGWSRVGLAGLPQAREDVRRLDQLRRRGGCCTPAVDPDLVSVPGLVPRSRRATRRRARVPSESHSVLEAASRQPPRRARRRPRGDGGLPLGRS